MGASLNGFVYQLGQGTRPFCDTISQRQEKNNQPIFDNKDVGAAGLSYDREIAASFCGCIIHMIWWMPSAEASIVANASRASSREMSTDA